MFKKLFEQIKVLFVGKKSNDNLERLDLTDQRLISQISEAEGRSISNENLLQPNYNEPPDIATPREFIEIPNGGQNLLERLDIGCISLNSNSKKSDLNLDLAEHAFRMDFESLKTDEVISVSPHKPLNSQSVDKLEQSLLRLSPEPKSR